MIKKGGKIEKRRVNDSEIVLSAQSESFVEKLPFQSVFQIFP